MSSKLCGCRHRCEDGEILFFNDRCFIGDRESIAVSLATVSPEFNPTNVSLCLSLKTFLLLINFGGFSLGVRVHHSREARLEDDDFSVMTNKAGHVSVSSQSYTTIKHLTFI